MEDWNQFFDETDSLRWKENFGDDIDGATYWRDLSPETEPHVAAQLHKNKVDPYEYQDWKSAEIDDWQEILKWKKQGADPALAHSFRSKGLNHDQYEKWGKLGLNDPDMIIQAVEDLGISYEDAEKFLKPLIDGKKFEMKDLPTWIEQGFKIKDIAPWVAQGFKYPSIAKKWASVRLTPVEAKEWADIFIYPEKAYSWIASDYKPEDAKNMMRMGYESPDEIDQQIDDNIQIKMEAE